MKDVMRTSSYYLNFDMITAMRRGIVFLLCVPVLTAVFSSCGGGDNSKDRYSATRSVDAKTHVERTVPPNPMEVVNEDGVIVSHAISLRTEPKYPRDFEHFEYVNPNAPKGGTIILAATGTYDSFHRYGQRGVSSSGADLFYDTLMVSSEDEIEVFYGLIAETVEYSQDYDWIIFNLRAEARHQDGKPILADDVVFSFYKFFDEGVSQFKTYYEDVISVEALDDRRVKFMLSSGDKEKLISLGGLKILPPQYWEGRDFSEPLTEPPLGSGAYRVSDYAMGQYVVLERLKDYWALDIPVIKGTLNFDYTRYDFYRDVNVQLEALKAGEIDMRLENVSSYWAAQYTGPNFDAGYIIKEELPDETPATIQRYVYNIQRDVFSDRRVRQAIGLVLDFEWLNRNLFYNQYNRTRSYFQGTPFESLDLPGPEELRILEPIRKQIPKEVFDSEFQPETTDGSGNIRAQIAKALTLLKKSGWKIRDGVLVNVKTGKPMVFDFLVYSQSTVRVAIPFQENLKKLGIEMETHMVDSSQYINRVRERDFDMIFWGSAGSFFPGSELQIALHSDHIDDTWNLSGINDPAIDYLVEGIVENQNNNQELLHWGRALDRVLQWNHYGVLLWHAGFTRLAYWDKFSRPEIKPKYSTGIGTWWYDEKKAAKLPAAKP
ncbi:ABC transporter, substrate-binding protein YejA [Olavius algarvensis spirochete endosymbiont]|uniref:extracellular solute-binding protein n=1 Tax=Olavius algarvensis spirochete endosymbiont TaxID=260710 RepID=UPI000A56DA97|nr:extracellular solute-binding protein [Olavius algarvensis spirochete endosymbiont]CAD7837887.1 MAG: ABC transporter, substrate-binding protein YejA [Olavius algarvensis spirochete endosymbiont]VDB00925.1 ABC transporter, substrate-binding protein YejA [Olavius algarvensis spirochete endosymbiont]